MKYKVVVDTNAVNNDGIGNSFFGNRKEIQALIGKIDLYVPEIVIKEIKEHKRKRFNYKKIELAKNELFLISGGKTEELNSLSAENLIEQDLNSEDIEYHILKIEDYNDFFNHFEERLLKKKPPFATDSDKGIKDAMIAYSTEKLLDSTGEDEVIILVTKDSRLKEYFEKNKRVRTADSIPNISTIIEHDEGKPIKTENGIKIDFSGIRKKSSQSIKTEKMLTNFRNSVSFQKTHELIDVLKKNKANLTKEEKADIIRSSLNNSQIRWIIKDQDIYDFLYPVYLECSDLLEEKEQFEFESIMGISHNFEFPS